MYCKWEIRVKAEDGSKSSHYIEAKMCTKLDGYRILADAVAITFQGEVEEPIMVEGLLFIDKKSA